MEGKLSNIFLNNYIRPKCKNFIGVFSSDDLPSDPLAGPRSARALATPPMLRINRDFEM